MLQTLALPFYRDFRLFRIRPLLQRSGFIRSILYINFFCFVFSLTQNPTFNFESIAGSSSIRAGGAAPYQGFLGNSFFYEPIQSFKTTRNTTESTLQSQAVDLPCTFYRMIDVRPCLHSGLYRCKVCITVYDLS